MSLGSNSIVSIETGRLIGGGEGGMGSTTRAAASWNQEGGANGRNLTRAGDDETPAALTPPSAQLDSNQLIH